LAPPIILDTSTSALVSSGESEDEDFFEASKPNDIDEEVTSPVDREDIASVPLETVDPDPAAIDSASSIFDKFAGTGLLGAGGRDDGPPGGGGLEGGGLEGGAPGGGGGGLRF